MSPTHLRNKQSKQPHSKKSKETSWTWAAACSFVFFYKSSCFCFRLCSSQTSGLCWSRSAPGRNLWASWRGAFAGWLHSGPLLLAGWMTSSGIAGESRKGWGGILSSHTQQSAPVAAGGWKCRTRVCVVVSSPRSGVAVATWWASKEVLVVLQILFLVYFPFT